MALSSELLWFADQLRWAHKQEMSERAEHLQPVADDMGFCIELAQHTEAWLLEPLPITLHGHNLAFRIFVEVDGFVSKVEMISKLGTEACPFMACALQRHNYSLFATHLEGLIAPYKLPFRLPSQANAHRALQTLEHFIWISNCAPNENNDLLTLINQAAFGALLPRRDGLPMQLAYFFTPNDFESLKSLALCGWPPYSPNVSEPLSQVIQAATSEHEDVNGGSVVPDADTQFQPEDRWLEPSTCRPGHYLERWGVTHFYWKLANFYEKKVDDAISAAAVTIDDSNESNSLSKSSKSVTVAGGLRSQVHDVADGHLKDVTKRAPAASEPEAVTALQQESCAQSAGTSAVRTVTKRSVPGDLQQTIKRARRSATVRSDTEGKAVTVTTATSCDQGSELCDPQMVAEDDGPSNALQNAKTFLLPPCLRSMAENPVLLPRVEEVFNHQLGMRAFITLDVSARSDPAWERRNSNTLLIIEDGGCNGGSATTVTKDTLPTECPLGDVLLEAQFTLHLRPALVVEKGILEQIEQYTGQKVFEDKPRFRPLLDLLSGRKEGAEHVIVRDDGRHTCQMFYGEPHEDLTAAATEGKAAVMLGVIVDAIAFTEYGHVQVVIGLLRRQALFNTLVHSCCPPCPDKVAFRTNCGDLLLPLTGYSWNCKSQLYLVSINTLILLTDHPTCDGQRLRFRIVLDHEQGIRMIDETKPAPLKRAAPEALASREESPDKNKQSFKSRPTGKAFTNDSLSSRLSIPGALYYTACTWWQLFGDEAVPEPSNG